MKFFAPAKLNLFLKINHKNRNGYHDIYSCATFINLFDEINIKFSKKNSIIYKGKFSPPKGYFSKDIIKKILLLLKNEEKKQRCLQIEIKKNIPYGAGLGGASADAAAVLRGLRKMKILKKIMSKNELSKIGADIPMCLHSKNCLIQGIGEKISIVKIPKYYFILIKPNFSLSTRKIYSKFKTTINKKIINKCRFSKSQIIQLNNDLEKVVMKNYPIIKNIIMNLSRLENSVFNGMSGSGSSCYAAFNSLSHAKKAHKEIIKKYPRYWSLIVRNNSLN